MRQALEMALDLATMHHTDAGYDELRFKVRQLIKEALAQQETPYKIGQRIAKTGGGISHLWSAVSQDGEIAEAERGFKEALAQPEQEPVAWIHTKIEGVVVPHRPADLDKYPDRWEALYKVPPPCPTCEALARTVMMDQTGRCA